MLPLSTELIEILKHDYLPYRAPVTKQLVLYFADLDLTITDQDFPDSDCFSLEDSLCGDELTFGDCVSACMKFQVEGITQELVGQEFAAKFVINSTDIKLGTFIVSEAPQADNDNVKAVVAYDLMGKFDKDVTAWYNGLDWQNTTYTLKTFRDSLCNYCGVTYTESSLPNDSMVVEKTIATNRLIGRDVLKSCEELNGVFGHMSRDGKLTHIVLSKSNPVDTIDSTAYESLVFEEYTTDPISKVQIRQEDGDVGAYSGTGDNCYTITGNFLAYGKTAEELATIANNVAANILGITYRPFDCTGQGLPYQDIGDYITLTGTETVNTYIMQSTLTGSQILDGKISAKGSKTLVEDHSLNIEIKQLQGKSAVLKRDVEGIKSTVNDLNSNVSGLNTTVNNMSTTVEQTAEGLSTEVKAREELQTRILNINACDEEVITEDDICSDDNETLTSQLVSDYEAKMLLLKNQFNVSLIDNVNSLQGQIDLTSEQFNVSITNNVANLQGQIDLTSEHFTSTISDLENDISSVIEELVGEINLRVTKDGLCNELNLSTEGLNFTGNRFTWEATNSSMTADGTLSCTNGVFSGEFINSGSQGEVRMFDGYIGFSQNGSVDTQIASGQVSTISLYCTYLNRGTPITSENYTSYCASYSHSHSGVYAQFEHSHSTTYLYATLNDSPTYLGTKYITFTNTSGDENVPTVGWVKAKHASDVRLKENFCELDIIDDYMKLKPCEYQYKDGILDDTKHFGFIAQDIAEMFLPNQYDLIEVDRECITQGERKYVDDYVMRINYDNFHAMHVAMIQKHEREIQEMQKRIDQLEELVRKLVKE